MAIGDEEGRARNGEGEGAKGMNEERENSLDEHEPRRYNFHKRENYPEHGR